MFDGMERQPTVRRRRSHSAWPRFGPVMRRPILVAAVISGAALWFYAVLSILERQS